MLYTVYQIIKHLYIIKQTRNIDFGGIMKKEKEANAKKKNKNIRFDCLTEKNGFETLKEEYFKLRHDKAVLLWEKRQLKHELETDELTGLKKTTRFEKFVFAAMQKHKQKKKKLVHPTKKERRSDEKYFVVFIDLDGLKMANDTTKERGGGHDVGDDLLRALANTLTKRTRKDDIVVRYAGASDEFGVFLTGTTRTKAEHSIDRIKFHFEENVKSRFPVLWDYFTSLNLKISFSYGIQEVIPEYTEAEIRTMLARADHIMHEHKERRKQDRRSMQNACRAC